MRKEREGLTFTNKLGLTFKIIRYGGWEDVDVKFDSTGYISNELCWANILKGEVKDKLHKDVLGVACIGDGEYNSKDSIAGYNPYKIWINMLKRCYCEKQKLTQPSYKDCYAHEYFLNFQNFYKWFIQNQPKGCGWQLDKDLLEKGNKIYGPDTCCMLPSRVNKLLETSKAMRGDLPLGVRKFDGVKGVKFRAYCVDNGKQIHLGSYDSIEEAFSKYKSFKEDLVRKIAQDYKDIISYKAYNALMNYTVTMED